MSSLAQKVDALFKVDGLQMHAEEDVHKVAKKRGDNHHLVEVREMKLALMRSNETKRNDNRSWWRAAAI